MKGGGIHFATEHKEARGPSDESGTTPKVIRNNLSFNYITITQSTVEELSISGTSKNNGLGLRPKTLNRCTSKTCYTQGVPI